MPRTFSRETKRSGALLTLEKGNADLGLQTDSWLEMLEGREGLIAVLEKLGWAYQLCFFRK